MRTNEESHHAKAIDLGGSDPARQAKRLGRESKLVGTGKDVNNSEGKRYYKAQGRGELSSIS